ncbi:MAG: YbhB/YbcL family Raf kinase inhibitor-like protein [Nanoarchaeota archaeon]|nr:YbhB/YbcL family Raf kinase inhibitor-like protein [Nanoarchaeota archaeon]
MKIQSVFNNKEVIPRKYTADGEDVNPPIEIIDAPVNAKGFALIIDDPDAPIGDWVHWIVFNIPADIKKIDENSVPKNSKEGINDFKRLRYGGPSPPSGTHRYFFKLYALDTLLNLSNPRKADLERAMQGHILAKAELIGLYSSK